MKATTSLSEAEHVPDIAVHACVLRKCGVPVLRYEILHLDGVRLSRSRKTIRARGHRDPVLARLDDLEGEIATQQLIVAAPEPSEFATGAHCAKPRECPFIARWAACPGIT